MVVIVSELLFHTMNRLSVDQLNQAMGMLQLGETLRAVSARFAVPHQVIMRARNRLRETGTVARRHGGGRLRATSEREDRYIVISSRRNTSLSATALQNRLFLATGIRVSGQTVRNRLHSSGLRSRVRCRVPALTAEHKRRRMQWALAHRHWSVEDWGKCIMTDETRVRLHSNDGRVRTWRRRGERFLEANVSNVHAYGGGSISLWGGISVNHEIPLVVLGNNMMTAQRYLNDVLRSILLPLSQEIGDSLIYVDDNARPHRARVVNDFFTANGITRMDWPSQSPDLNPIEHVWDRLKRCIRSRGVDPDNLEELRTAIMEEWDEIPREYIQSLIESMPRRVEAVIRSRGGPTRY